MIVKLSRAATGLAILLAAGTLQISDANAAEVAAAEVTAAEVAHAMRANSACVSRIVQLPLRWQEAGATRFDWCRASAYGATVSEQATRRAVMQACC